MRGITLSIALSIATVSYSTNAQTTLPSDQPIKAVLLEGMGDHHHPVSTSNAEAQKFFDQGLALMFGFNHDEAMRSFLRASELDPNLAMAHWGMAMTLGPNYNIPVDAPREKAAFEHVRKAQELSAGASQPERDYIAALSNRYSDDPKADLKQLDVAYRAAMRALASKYPDDLDAATLYAESMMLLRPWQLWTYDGKPSEDTTEIVGVLESVLRRDPDHLGANHFYIHAVEASRSPERALEAAGRLPGIAPGLGHTVHMPSHIYARVGDHEAAAGSNASAIDVDETYLKSRDDHGIYPMVYYNHNMHFLAYANTMQGRFADAFAAAQKLHEHAAPHCHHMQMMEVFAIAPELVLTRFNKWDQILALPQPDASLGVSSLSWHLARGLAYARTGEVPQAEAERQKVKEIGATLPAASMFGMLNPARNVLGLADSYLAARIAQAKKDDAQAIALFTKAVEQEDALAYDEPPSWWLDAREPLGAALLRAGKPAEAEAVFRKDLEWNVRSGRALFGLLQSLRAQNRTYDAAWIEQEFNTAWKNADTTLKIEDF